MIGLNLPNPFSDGIVTDPWTAGNDDVSTIHAGAFRHCCELIAAVRQERRSKSLLIHGEAGSGKTHLLGRLQRHLVSNTAPPAKAAAMFVAIRLQTSARMIWRYVRRKLVQDLLRTDANETSQLYVALRQRLGDRLGPTGFDAWLESLKQSSADLAPVEAQIDKLAPDGSLPRDLGVILANLLADRHRRDARAWLVGDTISDDAHDRLGLSPDDELEPEKESIAHDIVLGLCKVCGNELPIVFCFDQIEALDDIDADDTALQAFGQLVASLHDETTNVLLISCIQSAYLDRVRSTIRGANYHRLAEHITTLNPLNWAEVETIAASRMDRIPEVRAIRVGRSTLWPIEADRLRPLLGETMIPRHVIRECRGLFDAARGKKAEILSVHEFLKQTWENWLNAALLEQSPELTRELLDDALPMLVELAQPAWKPRLRRVHDDVDLAFEPVDKVHGPEGTIALSICNQGMKPLNSRLKRLLEAYSPADERRPPSEKLVLVRDPRTPITKRAHGVREQRDNLEQKCDAVWWEPSYEVLAALQALRSLWSDSQSGDLSYDGATFTVSTVREWLMQNLPRVLIDVQEMLVRPPVLIDSFRIERERLDRVKEELSKAFLMSVADAAKSVGCTEDELQAAVEAHEDVFGLLAGPPAVVFQRVSAGQAVG